MSTAIGSIINKCFQDENRKLNILCCPTHERYNSAQALTGHNFYAIRGPHVKDWNSTYAPVSPNYHLLDPKKGENQIPPHIDYDLVLSQSRYGQFQILSDVARRLHLPLLSLEHTSPILSWTPEQLKSQTDMRGYTNVFISKDSKRKWGYENDPTAYIIEHGIDTELFKPNIKENSILIVANEYRDRDYFLGFKLFEQIAKEVGKSIILVGDNPGMSKPAPSVKALAEVYGKSLIFLNTSQVSPIPMSLLEAMAAGCICVSTRKCEIPNIIRTSHKQNGILYDTAEEAITILKHILKEPSKFTHIGKAARATIQERFSLNRFVSDWDKVLRNTAAMTYIGGF